MATKVTTEQLAHIGVALRDLLQHYHASSLEVFVLPKSIDSAPLVVLFKDDNKKVIASREFPEVRIQEAKED